MQATAAASRTAVRSTASSLLRPADCTLIVAARRLSAFSRALAPQPAHRLVFAHAPSKASAPAQLRRSVTTGATSGKPAMAGETITLGGGCFWCLDACYRQLRGVLKSESGYAAGSVPNPTYKQVCSGTTHHAEVVQVTFDPSVISLKEILEVFFVIHDPTQLNRQGNDVGTQYRSIVLYHSPEQKSITEEVMGSLKAGGIFGIFSAPIVTQVQPYDPKNYYPAEGYHQNYYEQNPTQGYCQFVVAGKVAKLRSKFMSKLVK